MGTQSGSTNSGKPCAESGMFVGVDVCVRACVCLCVCVCVCVCARTLDVFMHATVCSTESYTPHWTITYQKCRIHPTEAGLLAAEWWAFTPWEAATERSRSHQVLGCA